MKQLLWLSLCAFILIGCKTEAETEEEEILEYIQKNNIPATPTGSGLYIYLEVEGTGSNPELSDVVKVDYEGKLLDGSVFESTYAQGQPAQFVLGQLIEGWQEGIQLMRKGGKATLIIPSRLGYGNNRVGPIPPNSILVFDIELLDF